jgi:nickel transport protein
MRHIHIFFLSAALSAFSCAHQPVWAHGTAYSILEPAAAIVVEFIYADHQPMQYAEVLVFSPQDNKTEYQNGRTDLNGRFSFYPNIPGIWRIQADDGLGHLEKISIEVAADDAGNAAFGRVSERFVSHDGNNHHHALPRTWGILLGISLIANLFMGIHMLKRGRQAS